MPSLTEIVEDDRALRADLHEAKELIGALEFSGLARSCPRCARIKSEGHTSTCRIGKFLKPKVEETAAA